MTKVVFLSLPAYGHVNPALALVSEIVDRGHEVIFYSAEEFADPVESHGAAYRAYRSQSLEALADFVQIPGRFGFFVRYLAKACFEILDRETERIEADDPIMVIHDSVAPWGKFIAKSLDLPAVSLRPVFAFNRNVVKIGSRTGY